MKVKLDRELFMEKISKLMKFVPGTTIIPAFDNIKFTFSHNGLMSMIASNGHIECNIKCEVKQSSHDFAMCVPAKLFYKTIDLLRENDVILTLKTENKLEVKCGKSKYNITLDCAPEVFPLMKIYKSDNEITMNQYYLKLGLRAAGKFVDDEGPNQNITAINIADVNNKIVFTGAAHGIMCRVAVKPISINKWDSICVTTEMATKVSSIMDDKGEVTIVHGNGKILLFGKNSEDDFEISCTNANIKFPDSEAVFNKRPESVMRLNTVEFHIAVKRLKLYSFDGERPRFSINSVGKDIHMFAVDNNTAKDGEEIIEPIFATGVTINRAFNNDLFSQILSNIDADEFDMYHCDDVRIPCFMVPVVHTEEENIFTFLLASLKD